MRPPALSSLLRRADLRARFTRAMAGYVLDEKLQIARKHLLPRQLECNGLSERSLELPEEAIAAVAEGYTREAGVRASSVAIETACRLSGPPTSTPQLLHDHCSHCICGLACTPPHRTSHTTTTSHLAHPADPHDTVAFATHTSTLHSLAQ